MKTTPATTPEPKPDKPKEEVLEAVFLVTVRADPGDFAALSRAQEVLEDVAEEVKVKSTRTVRR